MQTDRAAGDGKLTPETDNAGRSLDWLASARLIAWLLAILLTASPAWPLSSDVQPLDSIRAAVEDFLHNQLDHNPDHRSSGPSTTTIEVGALDPRLTLNHCELPLSAFLAPGARPAGKTTVGVRCEGQRPWTIYVSASIVSTQEIVVAAKALQRGQLLTADDVTMAEQATLASHEAYAFTPDEVLGLELKQRMPRGAKIRIDMLKKPDLVKKGQQVTLHSTAKGLFVTSVGVAMNNGSEGERVRVKNTKSLRVVEGVVQADGVVNTSPR